MLDELKHTISRIDPKETDPLQKIGRTLRMIDTSPLSEIISGVVESLDSIAQQLNKAHPIVLISDENIRIKNSHSEMLVNVFTHLLRNSMDHGLETREERKLAGKHPQGNLKIDLIESKNRLYISISDDGRGLAIQRIKAKAIEEGTITENDNLTVGDIANLLFESGVSTAKELTDISGRGVGMDAVRKFLQAHGGDIKVILNNDVDSEASYVPFTLRLDLPSSIYETVM